MVWIHAAERLGMKVVRDAEVFAAWNGQGELRIGTPETLDSDDCLAQMIFHEICHALVEGPDQFRVEDWGLDFDNQDHEVHEHAALRVQAALADPFQLRGFLASTTDFRAYYDRLGDQPLDASDPDPAVPLATQAWVRATEGPWSEVIADALRRTKAILDAVTEWAPRQSLWSSKDPDA